MVYSSCSSIKSPQNLNIYGALHNILIFHITTSYKIFVETHKLNRVSGDLPETLIKPYVSINFDTGKLAEITVMYAVRKEPRTSFSTHV